MAEKNQRESREKLVISICWGARNRYLYISCSSVSVVLFSSCWKCCDLNKSAIPQHNVLGTRHGFLLLKHLEINYHHWKTNELNRISVNNHPLIQRVHFLISLFSRNTCRESNRWFHRNESISVFVFRLVDTGHVSFISKVYQTFLTTPAMTFIISG